MTVPSRTMTSSQVAAVLHLSQATIARYVNLGRIPHDTTPGGHFRFDLAEVRAALADPGPVLPDPDELMKQVRELTKQVTLLTMRVEAYAEIAKKGA